MAAAFRQGLSETGFVEGRSVAIEYQWAQGQVDRLPVLAAELVRRRVAVIAAAGTRSARAAKAATTTIPIVFSVATDPIANGIGRKLEPAGALAQSVRAGSSRLWPLSDEDRTQTGHYVLGRPYKANPASALTAPRLTTPIGALELVLRAKPTVSRNRGHALLEGIEAAVRSTSHGPSESRLRLAQSGF